MQLPRHLRAEDLDLCLRHLKDERVSLARLSEAVIYASISYLKEEGYVRAIFGDASVLDARLLPAGMALLEQGGFGGLIERERRAAEEAERNRYRRDFRRDLFIALLSSIISGGLGFVLGRLV